MKQIQVKKNILQSNDELAEKNRAILEEKGIFTINLLGSPGAGKTSVLEQLIGNMKESIGMAVIEGDLYTTKDAERIEAQGIPVIQVNTGGACHLDAAMISEALHHLDLEKIRFLVIENVGNLVCPASYDLSEDMRITVLSITEGNDKPLKYPAMFQQADVLIVNKMDLIHFTNFSIEELYRDIRALNQNMKIFEISCRTGEGFQNLCHFLKQCVMSKGGEKDA